MTRQDLRFDGHRLSGNLEFALEGRHAVYSGVIRLDGTAVGSVLVGELTGRCLTQR